jgi:hypothetical protein
MEIALLEGTSRSWRRYGRGTRATKLYGTTAKNKNTAKMTKCTMP